LSVSYPVQAFPWWQFNSMLNYNNFTYNGEMDGTVIDLKADVFNVRMQNMLKLPGGIGMELTYYYNSPSIWGGSVAIKSFQGMNVGLRKDFFNRKFLVQLTGNDVFKTNSDYYYNSNYGGISTDGVRTFDNQRFGFSLTYNFGNQQTKARQKRRSSIDDEMMRISE
jgi:iron complex outermembrane recepter protein